MANYVMIFVPHQDDEICLMGEYLDRLLYKQDVLIKVVYLTNGDYATPASIRQAEALRAIRLFGIAENDVIFLGYPDTPYESANPYTESRLNAITLSIKQLLIHFTPNIIFCTDMDPHPDHRALSMCFSRAMAYVLQEIEWYRPNVFKGFAYSSAFYGKEDYRRIDNPPTIIPNPAKPDNPSLDWNSRICLKNPAAVNHTPLWSNRLYKALLEHQSQCGLQFYRSIINGDQAFFHQRTDNLLFSSHVSAVEVSSGVKDYLYDFTPGSLHNIMDPVDRSMTHDHIWVPDQLDRSPSITIRFKSPQHLEYIGIYGNPNFCQQQVAGKIVINGNHNIPFRLMNEFGKKTVILINYPNVMLLSLAMQYPCSGISELELFEKKENLDLFTTVESTLHEKHRDCIRQQCTNWCEWLYIQLSRARFRFFRKINYLAKRIKKYE